MTDFTYDKIAAPAPAPAQKTARQTARKSLWRLIFEAMIEARALQAERLVKEYQELVKRP